jgi:hypothetical protein
LKMEAACFSVTLVTIHNTKRCHKSEGHHMNPSRNKHETQDINNYETAKNLADLWISFEKRCKPYAEKDKQIFANCLRFDHYLHYSIYDFIFKSIGQRVRHGSRVIDLRQNCLGSLGCRNHRFESYSRHIYLYVCVRLF